MPTLRAIEHRVVEGAAKVYATSPASAAQIASASGCSATDIEGSPDPCRSRPNAFPHTDFLDASIAALNTEIAARLVPFEAAVRIVTSIPGSS